MIKLTSDNAIKVLKNLDMAREVLPKSSKQFKQITNTIKTIKPTIVWHNHKDRINNALRKIINNVFDGKMSEFTMWYINEYHKNDFSHNRLGYVYTALNEFIFTAQELLIKAHSDRVQEDGLAQRKLTKQYTTLINLIYQTRNYDKNSFVFYNAQSVKPFLRSINIHDVLNIKNALTKNGTFYNDMKKIRKQEDKYVIKH